MCNQAEVNGATGLMDSLSLLCPKILTDCWSSARQKNVSFAGVDPCGTAGHARKVNVGDGRLWPLFDAEK